MQPSITVAEAAEKLGCSQMFLRLCLRTEQFPFGTAIKGKRWSYYINAERLEAYLEARDLGGAKV